MEKELRLQIERLQEDKNYNDQMYREVRAHGLFVLRVLHGCFYMQHGEIPIYLNFGKERYYSRTTDTWATMPKSLR